MTLYEISKTLQKKMTELGELLQDGQEPSREQIDELIDLKGELPTKLVSYGYVIKNLTGELDVVDSEIKRLTAIKNAKKRHIETLTTRMQAAMVDNNLNDVSIDPKMPIKLKQNPPSVIVDCDIDKLPSEFIRIKTITEADKTALSKALKGGMTIDGVHLESKQSLKIG